MVRAAAVRAISTATILTVASLTLRAQAPFDLGLAKAARGELAEAAAAFQLAASTAASRADEARSRYNRGTVLVLAGALEEGIGELVAALRLDPDNDNARVNLAIARARLARQPPARSPSAEDLRRALDDIRDPSFQFRNDGSRAARRSERDW